MVLCGGGRGVCVCFGSEVFKHLVHTLTLCLNFHMCSPLKAHTKVLGNCIVCI